MSDKKKIGGTKYLIINIIYALLYAGCILLIGLLLIEASLL